MENPLFRCYFNSKAVTCDFGQNTMQKKGDFKNVARVWDAHVFLIHMWLTSLNGGEKKRKGQKRPVLNTNTLIHLHLHLPLCWYSRVFTAYTRFTASSEPLGWIETVRIIGGGHTSPPMCFICSMHTQHSAETRCEIYCNSRPPQSLI